MGHLAHIENLLGKAANGTSNGTLPVVPCNTVVHQQNNLISLVNFRVIPTLCFVGIVGNILNISILTNKRMTRKMKRLETSINQNLIALAASDLLFCTCAFPMAFVEPVYQSRGFALYYYRYASTVLNMFIMTSTWIMINMSIERSIALYAPLKAIGMVSSRRTLLVLILLALLATLTNLPKAWSHAIYVCIDYETGLSGYIIADQSLVNPLVNQIYHITWTMLGNIIPLLILMVTTICIIVKMQRSAAPTRRETAPFRRHIRHSPTNHATSVTLIVITVAFLLLVSPSELVTQLCFIFTGDHRLFAILQATFNLTQTANFAFNFVIFVGVNPAFRRTLSGIAFRTSASIPQRRVRFATTRTATESAFFSQAPASKRPRRHTDDFTTHKELPFAEVSRLI